MIERFKSNQWFDTRKSRWQSSVVSSSQMQLAGNENVQAVPIDDMVDTTADI